MGVDIPISGSWPKAVLYDPDNPYNTAKVFETNVIKGNVYTYTDESGNLGYYVAGNSYDAKTNWNAPSYWNWVAIPIDINNPNIIDHEIGSYSIGDIYVYSSSEIYIRWQSSGTGTEPHKDYSNNWLKINIPAS